MCPCKGRLLFFKKRPAGPKKGEKATSSVAPAIATMKMGLSDLPFDCERRNKGGGLSAERTVSNPNPIQYSYSVNSKLNTGFHSTDCGLSNAAIFFQVRAKSFLRNQDLCPQSVVNTFSTCASDNTESLFPQGV